MSVFQRKTTGSVVCPSCGSLVGVRDDKCYMCGRVNPGLWGFAPVLRQLGADLGFVPLVIGASSVLYVLTLVASGSQLQVVGGGMSIPRAERAGAAAVWGERRRSGVRARAAGGPC